MTAAVQKGARSQAGRRRPLTEPAGATGDPRSDMLLHVPALRAFAISLTRNPTSADDLVQDTLIKAWSNLDKFAVGTNLRAWLFTILRNTFYSDKRKHRRELPDPDGALAAGLFVRPEHDGKLAFAEFRRVFDQLSSEHREVLTLVGAMGFSYEDAAEMMGVAVGTVKSRASRARLRLAQALGLQEGESILSDPDRSISAVMSRSGDQAA